VKGEGTSDLEKVIDRGKRKVGNQLRGIKKKERRDPGVIDAEQSAKKRRVTCSSSHP